jgi:SNF2 family DNA or RNA helicase
LKDDPDYEPGVTNDIDIPLEPKPLPPAKPLLPIILPELIEQWAQEIRRFSDKFRPVLYHGDKRAHSAIPKVDGLLAKSSPYINGDDKNGRVIIITSLGLDTVLANSSPFVLTRIDGTQLQLRNVFSSQTQNGTVILRIALTLLIIIDKAHKLS